MRTKQMAVVVAGVLAMAGTALAGQYGHRGNHAPQGGPVSIESVKKFQEESTALRNEMMIKRVELRNEHLKQPVDAARVAALRKEMTDLRTKISSIAASNGLPEMGMGMGEGCGNRGKMGMGRGMGMMQAADQGK